MVNLAASARLQLSDPRRAPLDVSWSFSLPRAPGSDRLAARMAQSALGTLGAADGAQVAGAMALACRYVLDNGLARRYRVTLAVDGPRCAVSVTDYGYDQPGAALPPGAGPPPPPAGTTGLRRQLSAYRVAGAAVDDVQVHHAVDGAVLVRFGFRLLLPGEAGGGPFGPSPGLPGTSRSPDPRG